MSHVLTESATYTTNITVPDDGDQRNAASVNVAFQGLANRLKYLINGPFLWSVGGGGLTVTGVTTLSGGLNLSTGLAVTGAVVINSGGSFTTQSGAASFLNGTVTVNSTLSVGATGTVSVLSGGTFTSASGSTFTLNGAATANSSFTFAGSLGSSNGVVATWNGPHTFNSATTFNSAVSVASGNSLSVSGASTLTGNVSCGGSLGVTGTTTHTGDAICNGAFVSNGIATTNGTLNINGLTTCTATLLLSGAGHIVQRFSNITLDQANTLSVATADYYNAAGTLTAARAYYVLKTGVVFAGCRMTVRIVNGGNFGIILYSATNSSDTSHPIIGVYTFGTPNSLGIVTLVFDGTDWQLDGKVYPVNT